MNSEIKRSYPEDLFGTDSRQDVISPTPSEQTLDLDGQQVATETVKQQSFRRWLINAARCYSNVFRDEPWQEAFINNQGEFLSLSAQVNWRESGLRIAYPLRETAEYIAAEISKPRAVVAYRVFNNIPDKVIGFSWGYSIESISELVDSKWQQASDWEKQVLEQTMSKNLVSEPFWYFSEIGVLSKYRRKGMALEISQEMISKVPAGEDILVRTNVSSPLTVVLKKLKFRQILGPETIIYSGSLSPNWESVVNQLDPVNQDRVVYLLPSSGRSE